MFSYVIKYNKGKEKIIADVLFRRYVFLNTLNTRLLGFEHVKELYVNGDDLGQTCGQYEHLTFDKYFRHDEYLFKDTRLCVPKYLLHELLVREV